MMSTDPRQGPGVGMPGEQFEFLAKDRARDYGEPLVHRGQLIFDSRWAGGLLHCAENWSVGVLFWTVWLSIWLPVLTLALWVCAPAWGWTQFELNGHDNLITVLLVCLLGILLGSLLSLWGTTRWLTALSAPATPVADADLVQPTEASDFFALPVQDVLRAQQHRRLVMHHDAGGKVVAVEATVPSQHSREPGSTASPQV